MRKTSPLANNRSRNARCATRSAKERRTRLGRCSTGSTGAKAEAPKGTTIPRQTRIPASLGTKRSFSNTSRNSEGKSSRHQDGFRGDQERGGGEESVGLPLPVQGGRIEEIGRRQAVRPAQRWRVGLRHRRACGVMPIGQARRSAGRFEYVTMRSDASPARRLPPEASPMVAVSGDGDAGTKCASCPSARRHRCGERSDPSMIDLGGRREPAALIYGRRISETLSRMAAELPNTCGLPHKASTSSGGNRRARAAHRAVSAT